MTVKSGPHKAKKDIFVLKLARRKGKNYRSPYRNTKLPLNEILTSEISFSEYGTIEKAYHSLIDGRSVWGTMIGVEYIFLAKIPKGATYYIGTYGEMASDQFCMIEPIVSGGNDLPDNLEPLISAERAIRAAIRICKSHGIKIGIDKLKFYL